MCLTEFGGVMALQDLSAAPVVLHTAQRSDDRLVRLCLAQVSVSSQQFVRYASSVIRVGHWPMQLGMLCAQSVDTL